MKMPDFNKDILTDNKQKAVAIGAGVVLSLALIGGGVHTYSQNKYAEEMQKQIETAKAEQAEYTVGNDIAGFDFDSIPYVKDGYSNLNDYWNDVQEMRSSAEGIADSAILSYGAYMTDEQKAMLRQYENSMTGAATIEDFNSAKESFDDIVDDCRPVYVYIGGGYNYPNTGLTRSGGVNYYDGRKETYYSSNVLYHYRTGEWTVDDEGFYRTDDGYYVVAASDMKQGTTFEGSKGTCIVLDSGCAAGTTDYYVAW